jgi:urea transporter
MSSAAAGEVVLVAAVAVAGRVGVVLEQVDGAADALLAEALLGRLQQALEDALAGLVVHHQVVEAVALGVAYSGCEPTSRYRRAPFWRNTLLLRPQLTTLRNR